MLFIRSSKVGFNKIIIILKSFWTFQFLSAGHLFWSQFLTFPIMSIDSLPLYSFFSRLIVTENAQCGLWNQWCSAHKKPRNARISHNENPSKSDAVKFCYHCLDTEPYSFFNFKASIYTHFQLLLQSPDKALLLTDANFPTKVNPSRKYPTCKINILNLFDEDGDPIFNIDAQSSPNPGTPTTCSTKPKPNKQNTGLK